MVGVVVLATAIIVPIVLNNEANKPTKWYTWTYYNRGPHNNRIAIILENGEVALDIRNARSFSDLVKTANAVAKQLHAQGYGDGGQMRFYTRTRSVKSLN